MSEPTTAAALHLLAEEGIDWSGPDDFRERLIAIEQEAAAAVRATQRSEVVAAVDGFAERACWYFLMTTQGGPDGSELDEAVRDDMHEALVAWAKDKADPDYLAALTTPTLSLIHI